MEFKAILFSQSGDYYSTNKFEHKSYDSIVIKNFSPTTFDSVGYVGYFLVEEKDNFISGIRRYLKPDLRSKVNFKLIYVDHITDDLRELYGDYIEIISEYIGLKKIVTSFNKLIENKDVINNFNIWLENIIKDVELSKRDMVAQYVTKFANIYVIRIYERLYGKNIDLLKSHESEIVYKILETSLFQKIN
jgi:hypothetical protein